MAQERVAFKMSLKPGMMAEYERRHRKIWPELMALLREQGISEYSIFVDEETHTLFAFQKQAGAAGSQDLGNEDIVKRWWAYMADLMDTHEDHSPVSVPLREVFFME